MNFTPTDLFILSSVKINPSKADLDCLNNIIPQIEDWDYLTETAIEKGIGPLVYKKLPQLSSSILIPEPAKQKLQSAYYITLTRGMVLQNAFRKVAEAFTADGIQVVALKGIYLSELLYKDIGLRQFSDIDLLVKEADGVKCIKILDKMGYKPYGNSVYDIIREQTGIVHYLPMVLNGVSIEIHIRLHLKSKNYNIRVDEFIKSATTVNISTVNVYALNTYDLLIHLCVHLDTHFVRGDIQFNGFADIVNVLDDNAAEICWADFIERCRNNECEKVVFKYLLIATKYFNVTIPEEIVNKYESSLSDDDEKLFISYLHGFRGKIQYNAIIHWQVIRNIKGLKNKIGYFLPVVFPTKEFMIQSYPVKNQSLYWIYYPVRFWYGLRGLWKVFRR